jgi:hypothetical protein
MEEVLTEEERGEIEAEEVRKIGALLSPEAAIMLPLAILLDIAGIICTILVLFFGVGEILSWISDGIGFIIFGLWIMMRSQAMARPRELVEKVAEKRVAIKKAVKGVSRMGRGLRFAISIIGEIIPIVGTLPFWTWLVWSELKS